MIPEGFLLETMKWQNITLGEVPLKYLNMIAATPLTVYDIYLHVKKIPDKKNIRKTLQRLEKLGLIEVVEGEYPHNAKPYRLTTQGLFQYLLNITVLPYALKQYENNILLDMLLYQFLEPETLTYFYSIYRIELLNRYFKRCCRAMILRFGEYARSKWIRWYNNKQKKVVLDFLIRDMDRIIMREIKSFIFEVVISCKPNKPQVKTKDDFITNEPEDDFITLLTGKQTTEDKKLSTAYSQIKGLKGVDFDAFKVSVSKYGPNFEGLYPIHALSRDNKFKKMLKEMQKEFMDGSKELLYLTP